MRYLVLLAVLMIAGCDAERQTPPSLQPPNGVTTLEAGGDGYPIYRNGTVVKHKITGERAVIVRHPRKDDEHIIDVCTGKFGGARASDVWSETEVTPDQ